MQDKSTRTESESSPHSSLATSPEPRSLHMTLMTLGLSSDATQTLCCQKTTKTITARSMLANVRAEKNHRIMEMRTCFVWRSNTKRLDVLTKLPWMFGSQGIGSQFAAD